MPSHNFIAMLLFWLSHYLSEGYNMQIYFDYYSLMSIRRNGKKKHVDLMS